MKPCNFCWEDGNHELEIRGEWVWHEKLATNTVAAKTVYFCDDHVAILEMITFNDRFFEEIE